MEKNMVMRIQELCKERGITLTKLENELGFGRGAIYKWGKSNPSTEKLHLVASYFNVSIDYLLGTTTDRTPLNDLLTAVKNQTHGVAIGLGRGQKILPSKEGYALINYNTGEEQKLSELEYKQVCAFLSAIGKK